METPILLQFHTYQTLFVMIGRLQTMVFVLIAQRIQDNKTHHLHINLIVQPMCAEEVRLHNMMELVQLRQHSFQHHKTKNVLVLNKELVVHAMTVHNIQEHRMETPDVQQMFAIVIK